MRLTQWTDYTLRVLMYCAANSDNLSRIPEIAKAYNVSELFLFKILQPLANGYLLFTHWPVAADRQIIDVRVCSPAHPGSLREEFAAANMLAATRDVLTEDIAMSQVQQRGRLGEAGDGRIG